MSTSIRKRLRGLERLLQKGGLPDDVRRSKEAEVKSLKSDVTKSNRVQRERHFSKKYHGVKFIERRKVERRVAALKRSLVEQSGAGGASAALEADLKEAEYDLLYIRHFPRSKKYLSLFPGSDGDDAYVVKRRRQIRSTIIRRVEAGLPIGSAGDEDGDEEEVDDDEDADDLEDDAFFALGDDDGEDDKGLHGMPDGGHAHKQLSVEADSAIATKKEKRKKRAV